MVKWLTTALSFQVGRPRSKTEPNWFFRVDCQMAGVFTGPSPAHRWYFSSTTTRNGYPWGSQEVLEIEESIRNPFAFFQYLVRDGVFSYFFVYNDFFWYPFGQSFFPFLFTISYCLFYLFGFIIAVRKFIVVFY